MRETIKVQIDDQNYAITHLPPGQALKIMSRLTKLIGGPAGKALISGGDFGGLMNSDVSDALPLVGELIAALSERLDEDMILDTIKELLSTVHIVNGDKQVPVMNMFDVQFTGKTFHLLKLVKSTLEVNYGDFFVGLSGLKEKISTVMMDQ